MLQEISVISNFTLLLNNSGYTCNSRLLKGLRVIPKISGITCNSWKILTFLCLFLDHL